MNALMKVRSLVTRLVGLKHNLLFKRLSMYGASASISQVILMVYAIVVARQLGSENYGLFASNYALAGITIFLVNWGMDTWMLREGGTHPNPERLSGVVLQTKLLMGILWAGLLVGIAPLVRPTLFPRELLLVVVFDQLCDSCLITIVSGLNIARRTDHASRVLLIARAGRLISAILLIFALQSRNPFDYALLRLLTTLIGAGFGVLFLSPAWGFTRWIQPAETLRASYFYGLTEALSLVYAQVDVTLLGLLTVVKQVGEYAPAVSLINALTVVPSSVFYILVPILTNVFLTERQRFSKVVRQMGLIYLGVGLVLAVGTAVILSPMIAFFLGKQYEFTSRLVLMMSPIPLLKAISFAGATYLVVVGMQAKRIGVQIVSALFNIGLNLIFIPLYGPFAAGIIYVISEFILMIGYLLMARHYYRYQPASSQPTLP
jgi:O-antigen/teichoic acid export membrane protein